MNKPLFVWIISILAVIGLLSDIFSTISKLNTNLITSKKIFIVASLILSVMGMVFIYYFFTLNKKAALWNNVLSSLFAVYIVAAGWHDQTTMYVKDEVLSSSDIFPGIVVAFVGLLIVFLFWNLFRLYIKRNQAFT